jgi:hypothetical protein
VSCRVFLVSCFLGAAVNNRTLLLRQVYASKVSGEQSSHLECPGADAEGRPVDESKHKISPIVSDCQLVDNEYIIYSSVYLD